MEEREGGHFISGFWERFGRDRWAGEAKGCGLPGGTIYPGRIQ